MWSKASFWLLVRGVGGVSSLRPPCPCERHGAVFLPEAGRVLGEGPEEHSMLVVRRLRGAGPAPYLVSALC